MTGRPLVLIVDDSEQNRKLARDVLRASGLATLEATTGAEGIALAGEHLPDVVLLDLRLPDMDGADAARALADDVRTAHLPIVALSAIRIEGELAPPFAGHIEKPIDIRAFPDQVRAYCARARG